MRDPTLDAATRLASIKEGIAAEDRALALKPEYLEAMTYKNILLRMQANLETDQAKRDKLIKEADELKSRAMAIMKAGKAGQ